MLGTDSLNPGHAGVLPLSLASPNLKGKARAREPQARPHGSLPIAALQCIDNPCLPSSAT